MKTIANIIHHNKFPLIIRDNIIINSRHNIIYSEYESGYWYRRKADLNGTTICWENSNGHSEDHRV